jgi:glucose-1-phosphate thymidylyltransferase
VIGVIPAAGYATRLGAMPSSKEMLEIDGEPVIEHLVARMEAGGCTEIRVVTRPEKADIRQYAVQRGLTVVLARPPHVGASVAAGLAGCDQELLVALGYPDTLWEPLDGFATLRALVGGRTEVVLGLFDTPDAARSDVVVTDESGRVTEILVKPPHPPSTLIWGCLVARAAALAGIDRVEWPSELLRPLIGKGRMKAHYLSDRWLDIGTPEALERALHSRGHGAKG